MNSRTKLSLAAVAVFLLLLCLWLIDDSSAPSLSDAEASAEVEEPRADSPLEAPLESPPIAVTPDLLGNLATPEKPRPLKRANDATVTETEDHGRYAYELDVEVVGRLGRPIREAFVWLAPDQHPSNNMGMTAASGKLRLRWEAHVGFMNVAVAAAGPQSTWSGFKTIRVLASVPQTVQVILPGEEFMVQTKSSGKTKRRRRSRRESLNAAPWSLLSSPIASHSDGVSRFSWSMSRLTDEELNSFGTVSRDLRRELRASGGAFERLRPSYWYEREEETPEGLVARGTVYDSTMKPAAGALVTVGQKPQAPMMGVFCDSNGAFEIAGLEPGYWHVWAGGGEFGVHREEVLVGTNDAQLGKLVLDRGLDYAGEVVSLDSRPLTGWVVELEGLSRTQLYNAVVRTGADGRFSFANVPEGTFKVHVGPYDSNRVLPVKSMDVPTDRSFLIIQADGASATKLDVEIGNLSDISSGRVAVRVMDEASGRGLWCNSSRGNHFTSGALPAGDYSIMAVSATRGVSMRRRARIRDGDELFRVDLSLPENGSVVFEDGQRTWVRRVYTVWKKGAEIDSRVAVSKNRISSRMELPWGEYSLVIKREDGGFQTIPFSVFANQDTLVVLPAEDS